MHHPSRRATGLLGALVADAASLGLHWIYDVDRIAEIANRRDGKVAFTPIDAANFEGVPAYFAHAARSDGQLSQYGENLWLAMQELERTNGMFDATTFQDAFVATFGAGGSYNGYIDRPTRGALDNIAADNRTPSGIDDDQLPATSRLPAILATLPASADVTTTIADMMSITNVNTDATDYGAVFVELLTRVQSGEDLTASMNASASNARPDISTALKDAMNTPEKDSVAYGEVTKRACHLPMALPLAFHIMTHATSFEDAVDRNIRAGGDSAGRSIIIGAVMGAANGLDAADGIPLDWILSVADAKMYWATSQALALLSANASA